MSTHALLRAQLQLTGLLLVLACAQLTAASGVFELQFDRLQELSSENYIPPTSENNNHQESSQRVVRVLVCLKEAFTSKLDGPCTFGNSSITLGRTTSVKLSANNATSILQQAKNSSSMPSATRQHSIESHMTNLVRIPFTFRWTKSFTIILVVEELSLQTSSPSSVLKRAADPEQELELEQERTHQQQRITIKRYLALSGKLARPLPPEQLKRRISSPAPTPPQPPDQLSTVPEASLVVGSKPAEEAPLAASSQQQEEPPMNGPHFIDRHVLTENEVLPNLETNPNKLWSSRFSRSLKSSIAYRFRVFCSLNYFGDGCTVFCRARDDHFGHYNCSSTGQKVCHEGWQGQDCDKARCRQGCAGHCDRPDTCLCRPGWTGSRCDECITYPGCGNGYCLSAWQCICNRNWGGQLCDQDLNYCGTHEPCKNNGTCHNVAPGRYKCNCPEGFTGVDCDISLKSVIASTDETISKHLLQQQQQGCTLNPCLNGGVCLEFRGLEQQSDNRLLTQTDSLPTLDSNHTLAPVTTDNLYRCQCLMGWLGDFCQWPDASYLALSETSNDTQESHIQSPIVAASFNPSISDQFSSVSDATPLASDQASFTDFPTHIIKLTTQSTPVLELKHLISWILIASVIGVFLAVLILAWCCLVAVERSKFSLIQMNFVRNIDTTTAQPNNSSTSVSNTLQRFHDKIRDSLRLRNSSKIKPETKLSIQNALTPPKPPPSYEESNCDATRTIRIEFPPKNKFDLSQGPFIISANNQAHNLMEYSDQMIESDGDETKSDPHDVVNYSVSDNFKDFVSKENLVIREEVSDNQQELNLSKQATASLLKCNTDIIVGHAQLNCPRHGHLYRNHHNHHQQQQHHHHQQQQHQHQRSTLRNSHTSPS